MLGREYPAMFKYEDIGPVAVPAYTGYGLGGLKGLKALPDRICNLVKDLEIQYLKLYKSYFQYRDKQRGRKGKRGSDQVGAEDEQEKDYSVKGKKKLVYGVNNAKYYSSNISKQCVESLRMAGKIEQFETREKIFQENGPALMKLIRFSAIFEFQH